MCFDDALTCVYGCEFNATATPTVLCQRNGSNEFTDFDKFEVEYRQSTKSICGLNLDQRARIGIILKQTDLRINWDLSLCAWKSGHDHTRNRPIELRLGSVMVPIVHNRNILEFFHGFICTVIVLESARPVAKYNGCSKYWMVSLILTTKKTTTRTL